MSTAHKTSNEYREYFDSPIEFDRKVTQLAEWIRKSKHFIAFTGAGISTSAGISDFRSGIGTASGMGPGVWTARAVANGEITPETAAAAVKATEPTKSTPKPRARSTLKAVPTPAHMSLVTLYQRHLLKYLISQNCDGLHRRSGFPTIGLSELHGNSNVEKCKRCKREYLRDFHVRTNEKVHQHETGRRCNVKECGGELVDTIVNFGENLPSRPLQLAGYHAGEADLCLVLGSSLRVTPAADLPAEVAQKGGKLVIVNLQATPLDEIAAMRINGKVDEVINLLMQKLEIPIPEFRLKRRFLIKINPLSPPPPPTTTTTTTAAAARSSTDPVRVEMVVEGVDLDSQTPMTLFRKVELLVGSGKAVSEMTRQEQYRHTFKLQLPAEATANDAAVAAASASSSSSSSAAVSLPALPLVLIFYFMGHYDEPPFEVRLPLRSRVERIYELVYDPYSKEWEAQQIVSGAGEGKGQIEVENRQLLESASGEVV